MPKPTEVFDSPHVYRAVGQTEWTTSELVFVGREVGDDEPPVEGSFRMISASHFDSATADEVGELPAALAHLELTEDAIARFVHEYGFLGFLQTYQCSDSTEYEVGEQFDAWVEAVTVFRIVFRAVHGERPSDESTERFTVEAPYEPLRFNGQLLQTHRWIIASDLCLEPDLPTSYVPILHARHENLPTPLLAGEFLLPIGSEWTARTQALCEAISNYTSRLVGVIAVADAAGHTTLKAVPWNLLGAAWLQLARDMETEQEVRYLSCPVCDRWYRTTREDQTTCGRSKCRGKLYEQRRDLARTLHDSGASISDVAAQMSRELGKTFSVAQVEKLVAASEKRRSRKQPSRGDSSSNAHGKARTS